MLREIFVLDRPGFEKEVHAFGMADDIENTRWGPGVRPSTILHFVIHGKGYFNGQEIRKNQGFVMYPNQIYEYHADPDEPWHYFWIILMGPRASSILNKYGLANDAETFQFYFRNNFVEACKQLLNSSDVIVSHEFLSGLLTMLLSYIQTEPVPVPDNQSRLHVEHAMNLIDNNYHLKIKVSDIADRLFLDPGYLYNIFIKYAGISPKEYLNTVRIKKACELLSGSDYLISEVARSVGYDDPFQFSKFFKSRLGTSPLDYRNRVQNTQG